MSHIRLVSRLSLYSLTHLSPSTFFNWCHKRNFVPASPLADLTRPRVPQGLKAYFTPEQFQRLLQAIEEDLLLKGALKGAAAQHGLADLPAIVRLAVETGLRRGELLHLRWLDVDLRAGLVHVRAYHDRRHGIQFKPKDTDARAVPLSPTARALLRQRSIARTDENDSALVFPSSRTWKVRDGRQLYRTFKKYVRLAGLPDELHFHSLRHTFASWLASGGTPIVTIQRWMGHSKIEQTMVYADLLPSALAWQPSPFHEASLLTPVLESVSEP